MKKHAYAIQVLGGVLVIHQTQLAEREREGHADEAENRYRECCLRNLRMQIAELRTAIRVLEGEGEEVTTKGAKYAKGGEEEKSFEQKVTKGEKEEE